jgi:5'/3'-nucleotidase SurE
MKLAQLTLLTWLAIASHSAIGAGLNIALTNDDGWDAVGIQALMTVLSERGHAVTLVGSLTQQSGSSAAINSGVLTVRKEGERQYSAAISATEGAEPLVSGMLAIDIATRLDTKTPDLLVSGINHGANIGSATQHSGTVGAVIGALSRGINKPIPGIAISSDDPDCAEQCIEDHYLEVAAYLADLVDQLRVKAGNGESILPAGIGLNINYPPLPRDEIKGVKIARQGRAFGIYGRQFVLTYACAGCAGLAVGESAEAGMTAGTDAQPDIAGADTIAFNAGYITIVPIQGDYTADDYESYAELLGSR